MAVREKVARLTCEVLVNPEPIPDDKDGSQEEEDSTEHFDDDVADEGELHAVEADVDFAPGRVRSLPGDLVWTYQTLAVASVIGNVGFQALGNLEMRAGE